MDEKRQRDEAFLREWTIPEEDRTKYTAQPWDGEYRWFRLDPPMLCAWSTTGAVYDLTARSAVDQPFVALTGATAAMQSPTGAIFTYRKHNKPALGPTGDSLDDLA